jgi:hypothetical protein
MKLLLLVLAWFCTMGTASARTPFQVRCEDTLSKTASRLTARHNGYRIDNTLSYRMLTSMKGGAPANSYVLGLTRTESRVTIGVDGAILSDPPTAYECVAPRVEVSLSFLPIVIYVGREFPPGSCSYQEILAHEMRHLNTYLDYLPKVETGVRAALNQRFVARPLYAPAGRARALLQQEIDSGWMPYIKTEMGKVEALQAAIDTPQEYSRLSKVCQGEVQSFIRPAHGTRS